MCLGTKGFHLREGLFSQPAQCRGPALGGRAGAVCGPGCLERPTVLSSKVLWTKWSPTPRTGGLAEAPDSLPLPLPHLCPQLSQPSSPTQSGEFLIVNITHTLLQVPLPLSALSLPFLTSSFPVSAIGALAYHLRTNSHLHGHLPPSSDHSPRASLVTPCPSRALSSLHPELP